MPGQAGAHLGVKDNVADSIRPVRQVHGALQEEGRCYGVHMHRMPPAQLSVTTAGTKARTKTTQRHKPGTCQDKTKKGQSRNNEDTGKTKGVPRERL